MECGEIAAPSCADARAHSDPVAIDGFRRGNARENYFGRPYGPGHPRTFGSEEHNIVPGRAALVLRSVKHRDRACGVVPFRTVSAIFPSRLNFRKKIPMSCRDLEIPPGHDGRKTTTALLTYPQGEGEDVMSRPFPY